MLAEGRLGVGPLRGPPQHAPADVHAVHAEHSGRHAGGEQGHGHRVRLLAGAAWHAKDSQRPGTSARPPVVRHEMAQAAKRLHVPEKPRFGNDQQFHKLLELLFVRLQEGDVASGVLQTKAGNALVQCMLDVCGADGTGIQADATQQPF